MRVHYTWHSCLAVVGLATGLTAASASAGLGNAPLRDAGADAREPGNGASVRTAAAGDGQRQYHYCYFKQEIALALDAQRIAVFRQPGTGEIGAAPALQAAGITAAGLSPGPLAGWSFAALPSATRSEPGVRRIVRDLAAAAGQVDFASPVFMDKLGPVLVTPDLLVGFNDGVTDNDARAILDTVVAGNVIDASFGGMNNVYRVRSGSRDGLHVLETANALAQRAEIRFAEPDMIRTAQLLFEPPNDPLFPRQWALHNTGQNPFFGWSATCCPVPCPGDCWPPCPELCLAPFGLPCDAFPSGLARCDVGALAAWEVTTGDPSIIVVVFDTGIQLDHPELQVDPSLGMDFCDDDGIDTGGHPDYRIPCDGHGTLVAGLIRAQMNNEIGIAGLAPTCSVASARVLRSTSTTNPCGNAAVWMASWIVSGLEWAEDELGARITNHSYDIDPSSTLTAKLEQTRIDGMVHFAAAGNNGAQSVGYPARLDAVNGVSALDHMCVRWSFSNYGPGLDFAAPGAWIYSTDVTGDYSIGGYGVPTCNDYGPQAGTSSASPIAAAVAALVLSVDPTLTPDHVEQIMRQSAVDLGEAGHDEQYGWGMVNAFNAVVLARNCLADLNDDGVVDLNDLTILLSHFGGPGAPEQGDINRDGNVDINDLTLLLSGFGTTCP